MTNEEKEKCIRPWINPEERVTVRFLDATDLNTIVTGCTDQSVDLSIETHVPHLYPEDLPTIDAGFRA